MKRYKPAAHAVGMLSHVNGRPIGADGELFVLDRTIRKRLQDGDLVEVTDAPAETKSAAPARASKPSTQSE